MATFSTLIFCAFSGEIIPSHEGSGPSRSTSLASEDSFGIQVLLEPWPVIHNEALESSMRNRILVMENRGCIFLLDKDRG